MGPISEKSLAVIRTTLDLIPIRNDENFKWMELP